MQIKNTESRYGIVAMIFHWIMAIFIIAMLAVGLYMTSLQASLWKLQLYGMHKAFGLLVLFLAALRLGWYVSNVRPQLPATMPNVQKKAARMVQWILLAFMIVMPLTGWLLTSAAGLAPSFFGLFTLPTLVPASDQLRHFFAAMHEWLAYGLIGIICGHAIAALYHHFIDKDSVLRSMLPW